MELLMSVLVHPTARRLVAAAAQLAARRPVVARHLTKRRAARRTVKSCRTGSLSENSLATQLAVEVVLGGRKTKTSLAEALAAVLEPRRWEQMWAVVPLIAPARSRGDWNATRLA